MVSKYNEQYAFDFSTYTTIVEVHDPDLAELRALASGHYKKAAMAYEQSLIDRGIPVYTVQSENDTDSVEADYGAPIIGFSDFQRVLRPDRAYRYTPVTSVNGEYHTYIDDKIAIAQQMKKEGYLSLYNWADEAEVASQIHFANGGVTRAFSDIAAHVVRKFEINNALAKKLGRDQSGAIVVPVPTYGLFLYHLSQLINGHDIKIITVRRRDNGSVDRHSLKVKLQECLDENRRVIAYYDCNPNNPTGYIRDFEETAKQASILEELTRSQHHADDQFIVSLRQKRKEGDLAGPEESLLSFYYMDTVLGRPIIIDDMAYEGLEINQDKRPASFAQVSEFIAAQTVVLKGISKIGLPGMRIGLAIGDPEIIAHAFEPQLLAEFSANSFGVDVLTARYGQHPTQKDIFFKHQEQLQAAHKERFLFAKAFFKGIDHVPEMDFDARKKLVAEYASKRGLSLEEAETRLKKGLPNFYIQDDLQSGFFCTICFDSLRDRQVAIKYDQQKWPNLYDIDNSQVLFWTLRAYKIGMVAAVQQGASDKSLCARMTLSMAEKDFYRFYDQMAEMHDFFFGEKPQVQLDLFRRNTPTP